MTVHVQSVNGLQSIATAVQGLFSSPLYECTQAIDFSAYPTTFIGKQKSTIRELNNVDLILKGRLQSPSEAANLPSEGLYCVAARLDSLYEEQMKRYRERLLQACTEDAKIIVQLKKMPKYEGVMGGTITNIAGYGISWYRYLSGYEQQIRQEGSCFRVAWMNEVGALEDERLRNMKHILTQSSIPLVRELEELKKNNETNVELLSHLEQLEKIYQSQFKQSLEIDEVKVIDFISGINESRRLIN